MLQRSPVYLGIKFPNVVLSSELIGRATPRHEIRVKNIRIIIRIDLRTWARSSTVSDKAFDTKLGPEHRSLIDVQFRCRAVWSVCQ